MCDGPQPRLPFAAYRKHAGHETRQPRSARRNIEIPRCHFDGHYGCERAERFALLDLAVEPITHFSGMRCGENAAVTECARPEFKRALHPPDDATASQVVSNLIDERAVLELLDALTVLACEARQLRSVNRGTPKRVIGYIAIWISKVNAVGVKRRAHCASSVARGWWDEYPLEARIRKEARVGDPVQGNATPQT